MRGIELTPEHPVSELVEMGERAEDEGFDTLFASSHYNNRDPFVVLDRVAAATDDLRVGPGVVNPYETHPVSLASRVATLDEVSDGRAVCGLGAGDRSTLRNLGVERDRPLRRVLEAMQVSRKLWAGERVDHDGTFEARDAGLNYDVGPDGEGDIPVYVGAQGPHMIRMAAKHADGVLVNAAHPDDFAWAADQVEAGLAERPPENDGNGEKAENGEHGGKDDHGANGEKDDHGENGEESERDDFDFAAYASVSVAEDGAAAREAARPPVAFIAAGAADQVLDRHGLDRERAERIGDAIESGEFATAFEAVTPAMLDAFCIAGTPERAAEKIAAVLEYADSFVAGSPLGPDPQAAVSLVGAACDRSTRG